MSADRDMSSKFATARAAGGPRRRLAVVAGLTAAMVPLAPAAHAATADPHEWHETPTGLKTYVPYSIDPGGTALWTVGAFNDREGFRPVAARWDGVTWQPTRQPLAAGRLLDVDAVSPHNGGGAETPEGGFAYRYDGRKWAPLNDSVIGSPGYPYDLEALSASDLWVAAFDGSSTTTARPGPRWQLRRRVPSSTPSVW
ncbi:hypothetical protein [Kribbella deserti]|uniref:Glycosyl hydrolase family 32 N-terminal domain-containing protein n=1 Tax=Kribbella deserti TaxID=1926257 RepID=A0ABV6QRN7_9ACTN